MARRMLPTPKNTPFRTSHAMAGCQTPSPVRRMAGSTRRDRHDEGPDDQPDREQVHAPSSAGSAWRASLAARAAASAPPAGRLAERRAYESHAGDAERQRRDDPEAEDDGDGLGRRDAGHGQQPGHDQVRRTEPERQQGHDAGHDAEAEGAPGHGRFQFDTDRGRDEHQLGGVRREDDGRPGGELECAAPDR